MMKIFIREWVVFVMVCDCGVRNYVMLICLDCVVVYGEVYVFGDECVYVVRSRIEFGYVDVVRVIRYGYGDLMRDVMDYRNRRINGVRVNVFIGDNSGECVCGIKKEGIWNVFCLNVYGGEVDVGKDEYIVFLIRCVCFIIDYDWIEW